MPRGSGNANQGNSNAIVIGRKPCPPDSKVCWVLADSGEHSGNAVVATTAALTVYGKAFPAALKQAEADANAFLKVGKCGAGCKPNGTTVLGPMQGTQQWSITGNAANTTARTTCWVAYVGTVYCKKV